ncbi:MAG: hypothetical protein DCC43_03130 [Candidatus Brocadia sp.]|jgi:hypothetical protein|uniref:Carbonic anhydrase n=1 Tax=Candidatus Brocadia fulgida TaxID=380242 RepID=A0A0M2UYD0_9BACT|nr:MAG: hypothetical protein BROFUL_00704 [Candidatus Brocadia fulgida]MCC6325369.1 hypothetical protein [Candidatus Brocadia sp.]MCE7911156.1 hypothetical protein [Candidatus Brocadia sp. AMX3]OQY99391.1 MAG: hypothetical protein B6D35_09430 [Candidatus Brocadia sp. UTAMX2]MBV6518928.1 hypothetical protein [Candidatus Brocadia fulgida]
MKKIGSVVSAVVVLFSIFPIGCMYNQSPLPDRLLENEQISLNVSHDASAISDCDTLLITCIDYRFAVANQDFANDTLGLRDNYDHISIPGSIYNLVNPETRSLLFSKFALSVRMHLIKRVVIVSHRDCGAYGGSVAFGSEIAEYETLTADLKTSRGLFLEKYPTLKVESFLESLEKEGDQTKVKFEKIF